MSNDGHLVGHKTGYVNVAMEKKKGGRQFRIARIPPLMSIAAGWLAGPRPLNV